MIDLTTITPAELLAMIAEARKWRGFSTTHNRYIDELEEEAFRRRIPLPEEPKMKTEP